MIKLPPTNIIDANKVKLGQGNSNDLSRIHVKLPKPSIVDNNTVKLGQGNSNELRLMPN
jgi:hypothetical protein